MFIKLLRNIHILNLLLIAAALGFAYYLLFPLIDAPVGYSAPRVIRTAGEKPPVEAPPPPNVNPLEFTVIADQNLFHPERKIPPEKKAEAPLPKPEFVLYGTLITGDLGVAYMDDKKTTPVTTPGRGKRQTAVKKGEAFSGYVLKELHPDRVVMNRGEESLIVYLNDPQNPKAREVVAETGKPGSRPAPGAIPRPTAAAGPAGGVDSRPSPAAARPAPGVKPAPATTTAGLPAPTPGVALPPATGTPGTTGTSGTFTPARPRYRPLPPTPATTPYPAPATTPGPSPYRPYP